MSEEERNLMISIGKSLDEHLAWHKKEAGDPKPVMTPFDIPRPSEISTVEHALAPMHFNMEISFRQGLYDTESERRTRSYALLMEMETVLKRHGVITLKGDYDGYGIKTT